MHRNPNPPVLSDAKKAELEQKELKKAHHAFGGIADNIEEWIGSEAKTGLASFQPMNEYRTSPTAQKMMEFQKDLYGRVTDNVDLDVKSNASQEGIIVVCKELDGTLADHFHKFISGQSKDFTTARSDAIEKAKDGLTKHFSALIAGVDKDLTAEINRIEAKHQTDQDNARKVLQDAPSHIVMLEGVIANLENEIQVRKNDLANMSSSKPQAQQAAVKLISERQGDLERTREDLRKLVADRDRANMILANPGDKLAALKKKAEEKYGQRKANLKKLRDEKIQELDDFNKAEQLNKEAKALKDSLDHQNSFRAIHRMRYADQKPTVAWQWQGKPEDDPDAANKSVHLNGEFHTVPPISGTYKKAGDDTKIIYDKESGKIFAVPHPSYDKIIDFLKERTGSGLRLTCKNINQVMADHSLFAGVADKISEKLPWTKGKKVYTIADTMAYAHEKGITVNIKPIIKEFEKHLPLNPEQVKVYEKLLELDRQEMLWRQTRKPQVDAKKMAEYKDARALDHRLYELTEAKKERLDQKFPLDQKSPDVKAQEQKYIKSVIGDEKDPAAQIRKLEEEWVVLSARAREIDAARKVAESEVKNSKPGSDRWNELKEVIAQGVDEAKDVQRKCAMVTVTLDGLSRTPDLDTQIQRRALQASDKFTAVRDEVKRYETDAKAKGFEQIGEEIKDREYKHAHRTP